jgi:hypothetical protein
LKTSDSFPSVVVTGCFDHNGEPNQVRVCGAFWMATLAGGARPSFPALPDARMPAA